MVVKIKESTNDAPLPPPPPEWTLLWTSGRFCSNNCGSEEGTNNGDAVEIVLEIGGGCSTATSKETEEPEKEEVGRLLSQPSLTCIVANVISAGYILLPYREYLTTGAMTFFSPLLFVSLCLLVWICTAFAQAGSVLSSIVLLLVILQTYVSGNFLLVAGAHAEALNNLKAMSDDSRCLPENYGYALTNHRKYELSHLHLIFLSRIEATIFTITTLGDLYGITWALIAIFATTLAGKVPLLTASGDHDDGEVDYDSYRLYLFIFVGFAIPMSCTSIIDQVWVQMMFLFMRIAMVLCMLMTIFAAMGRQHFGNLTGPSRDVPLADFHHLVPVIMTSIFSTAYQFSVPGIAASARNIKKVSRVFQAATTFVFASNMVVAIVIANYFGRDGTLPSSNLLWNDYHGGGGLDGDSKPWWASALSGYVSLFAAIDGAAVYPLMVISLGDILMGTVYGDDVHAAQKDWKIRTLFRMLGGLPQAIGAMFVTDLGVIATYAGICTLLSFTTAPALLLLRSRQRALKAGLPLDNHYSTRLSSPTIAVGMIITSLAIVVAVIAENVG
jgi:hypothetical protein